jgi:hypothetical protein
VSLFLLRVSCAPKTPRTRPSKKKVVLLVMSQLTPEDILPPSHGRSSTPISGQQMQMGYTLDDSNRSALDFGKDFAAFDVRYECTENSKRALLD